MDRYIGMDVHAASTTLAVIDARGKKLHSKVVETNGKALLECLQTEPGSLHLCLEEGTQSTWLAEILTPHVTRVVVVHVSESRGHKNDERDAFALAEMLRTNAVKTTVYKQTGPFASLRLLVKAHTATVRDTVRAQNRLKALFRSHGVEMTGSNPYGMKQRETRIESLPESARPSAKVMFAHYDALQATRVQAEAAMVEESHRHSISQVLETCPGLGPIRVAQLVSVVITPERFRTRAQFWAYCGLGVVIRSSSDWVREGDRWQKRPVQRTRGLNLNHNHLLKAVFKGAATTVIVQHKEHPLRAGYQRQIDGGTKPPLAKVTLARRLAATALSMWKTQEVFDAAKVKIAS
ncbi:MAG: transposase [Polyangiales bacterium]